MNPILFLLYKIYSIFIYFPLSIFFLVLLAIFASLSTFINKQSAVSRSVCLYNKFILKIIPVKIEVEGRENIKENQSYVVIANHRSNLDPSYIYVATDFDFRWIMKAELLKIPVFGFLCKRMGNIAIDRKNPQKAISTINEVKRTMKNGVSVAFFPEGTRNNKKGMLPFKKGAFHFALDTNLPILPITMNYTDKILPKSSLNVLPGHAKIQIHKPIDIKKYKKNEIMNLVEDARKIMESTLDTSYAKD